MNSSIAVAAARFHALSYAASRNGGLWVSAGGGTANVAAGILSRQLNVSYKEAHDALDWTGGSEWYQRLAEAQPWPLTSSPEPETVRWKVETIMKAACRLHA